MLLSRLILLLALFNITGRACSLKNNTKKVLDHMHFIYKWKASLIDFVRMTTSKVNLKRHLLLGITM